MACTGHNATTPNGVACGGYVAPLAPFGFTNVDLNGVSIQEYHFNEIRTAVGQELTRRGLSWASVGGDPVSRSEGGSVGYLEWRTLRNNIYAIKTFTQTYSSNTNLAPDTTVIDQSAEELRTAINSARAVCVCQCNYACTCNCNYPCTCNCNYPCTCNCNYPCTCNCNYACTCNCNYSDIRLKKDIKEI
jgi:hypothetical protein